MIWRVLAFTNLAFWLGGYLLSRRWSERFDPSRYPAAELPPVTFFRPIKPRTPNLRRLLTDFVSLLRPGDQFVLGVAENQVDRFAWCHELAKPGVEIVLAGCREGVCSNPKINKLIQMTPRARCEHWIVLDSEAAPSGEFLKRLREQLTERTAATAIYGYRNFRHSAELADALLTSGFLWAGSLWAIRFTPTDFTFGACIAVTRTMIRAIGGWESLGQYLAEDFQLGQRLHRLGYRIDVCDLPLLLETDRMGWSDFFIHQWRVARTYRTNQPPGHFGSVLTHGLPTLLTAWLALGRAGWLVALATWILRAIWHCGLARTLGMPVSFAKAARVVPAIVVAEFLAWLLSWFPIPIRWGSRRLRVNGNGWIGEQ
jgi:ceramide glucosyltransferase